MKAAAALIVLSALAVPFPAATQTGEPGQTSAADTPISASVATPEPSPIPQVLPASDRPVSWKQLPLNLLSDQKGIWSFPARLARGQSWVPVTAVLGATAGLFFVDPTEAAYFRRTPAFQGWNNIFTGNATLAGTIIAPASLYAVGLVRKDPGMQHTALLAGEAVADAEIVTTVLKDATRRVRPAGIQAPGNFSDSWFESKGSLIRGNGSFPSGHSIAAFSVATVIARRYRNHRWVPYTAYGLAALVGFSRLSLSAHFLSDVFMGGALGYSISRSTVLHQ